MAFSEQAVIQQALPACVGQAEQPVPSAAPSPGSAREAS